MTDQSMHRVDPLGRSVSCYSIELDRDETGWLLTHYAADLALRLRIQVDDLGDAEGRNRITFEIKLHGADTFVLLGHGILAAYWFSPEGQEILSGIEDMERYLEVGELLKMPCLCQFPTAYLAAFVQMVSRWGHFKTRCLFSATVSGTPFHDSERALTCPRCGRRQ